MTRKKAQAPGDAHLTRRVITGLALAAPVIAGSASAADRITFADLWSDRAEFSERAKTLVKAGVFFDIKGTLRSGRHAAGDDSL
jgi:hypothetical protein